MEYGLQLYSVRDLTAKDFEGTLKEVAKIGYKYVEPAGFFGYSAEEVDAMMKKYGLKVSGTHTGWREVLHNTEECIAYHKGIGCDTIIIPGADIYTREGIEEFIELVKVAQPKIEAAGLKLGYHNHCEEFYIHGEKGDLFVPYMELLERTNINFEIDTYWAYAAGQNPTKLMERIADRLLCIHIKDGLRGGEGKPLGMGTAPCKDVYKKAVEMGLLMVVESETCNPTGMAEAEFCHRFLKAQECND